MCQCLSVRLFDLTLSLGMIDEDRKIFARPNGRRQSRVFALQNTLEGGPSGARQRVRTDRDLDCFVIKMIIGNENDQVK